MKKEIVSLAALLPFASIPALAQNSQKQSTPNVIFILADDLGIGDLGCYGQQQIKTPAIDRLAEDGMLFTRHYAGSTVSAPSRCVLLTGKHTGHSCVRGNKGVDEIRTPGVQFDYPLANSEITLGDIFKSRDYATACIGKWGLGGPSSYGHPNEHGFDYFFGYLGQGNAHSYYPTCLWENRERVELNNQVYSHDLIMEKAYEFIEENADRPFFLYLTPTLPHADLDVPEFGEYEDMFDEKPFINNKVGGYKTQLKPRAAYAAMVSRLDYGVGQIRKLLKEKGLDANTIVVFSSDNGVHAEGGHDPEYFDSNSIYRGWKRDLYEGGIHTPMIISWPGVVKEGSRSDHFSAFWDFMPTFCDILHVSKPKGIDGISFLNTLTGNTRSQKQHDYFYYEFHERGGRRCVIKGDWKLVELNVNNPKKTVLELYNIAADPSEEHNVIESYPDLAKKLNKIMLKSRIDNPVWNFTSSRQTIL